MLYQKGLILTTLSINNPCNFQTPVMAGRMPFPFQKGLGTGIVPLFSNLSTDATDHPPHTQQTTPHTHTHHPWVHTAGALLGSK